MDGDFRMSSTSCVIGGVAWMGFFEDHFKQPVIGNDQLLPKRGSVNVGCQCKAIRYSP